MTISFRVNPHYTTEKGTLYFQCYEEAVAFNASAYDGKGKIEQIDSASNAIYDATTHKIEYLDEYPPKPIKPTNDADWSK